MTLTEKFITDAIQLDSGAEVMYGSDQVYDTYPCRFCEVHGQIFIFGQLRITFRLWFEDESAP